MSLHPPLRDARLRDEEAGASEGVDVPSQQHADDEVARAAGSDAEEQPERPGDRRFPSTVGGACYLVVLGLTLVGLVIVMTGHWRLGLVGMACSLGIGAACRALLRSKDAGMLAVRNRWLDAAMLAAAGAGIWILAFTVPGY